MSSVQGAQSFAHELVQWLTVKNAHPDDVVPALLVVAARMAVRARRPLSDITAIVEAAFTEATTGQSASRH